MIDHPAAGSVIARITERTLIRADRWAATGTASLGNNASGHADRAHAADAAHDSFQGAAAKGRERRSGRTS